MVSRETGWIFTGRTVLKIIREFRQIFCKFPARTNDSKLSKGQEYLKSGKNVGHITIRFELREKSINLQDSEH